MNGIHYLYLLPPLLLVPAMGLLSMVRVSHDTGHELKRKALHVGTGLASLSLPLVLTEAWMVISGFCLAVAWMTAVRVLPCLRRHFGSVLHGCERRSMGETFFAAGVAALLLLAGDDRLLFAIPMLILSLADAAAAIAGRLIQSPPLPGFMRGKSAAGSIAFFVTAAVICLAMLGYFTKLPLPQLVGCALAVAAASCIAEASSRNGLDNLTVPLVTWAVLLVLPIQGG